MAFPDAIDMLKHAVGEHRGAQSVKEAQFWADRIADYEEMVRAAIWSRAPKYLKLPRKEGEQ